MTESSTFQLIKDSSLEGRTTGRVRELSGFVKKYHKEPDSFSPATERFIASIGLKEVEAVAEEIYEALKRSFGYRRKELELSHSGSSSAIRTPDFDVNCGLMQDPAFPDRYRITTEVGSFRNPAIIDDAKFTTLFDKYCDTILLQLGGLLDLAKKIDDLEESDVLRNYIEYDSQCTWFDLKIPGTGVVLRATPDQLSLTLTGSGDLETLLAAAQMAFNSLAEANVSLDLLK